MDLVDARSPRRRAAWWLLVCLWAALILTLASVNVLPQNHEYSRFLLRKAGHLGLYAVLALLLHRALAADARRLGGGGALLILALAAALGAVDEWRQSFVPGRTARVTDVELDLFGGAVGLLAAWGLCALRAVLARRRSELAPSARA